ncbi:M24 family metallopeptidase [Roseinatronobacter sp. S2]|uniref:M24 family metallopeptidase n=1 Tax=Roseinatronobacter sp. S2 TaxID=3035471 RepID=UPI0024101660|nr:M24 family metallopeptidase [Roseinatronobacter sp. S2]WFE76484.1 M24 family metallopeptidase [Roseinatronobacter sp. S2]
MTAHLDRKRAETLMQAAGMDALLLLSPEAFRHATGAAAGVATMWRQAGAVAVLVPADANLPEMAVASDLFAPSFRRASHIADLRTSRIWVEAATAPDLDAQGDAAAQMRALWQAEGRGDTFTRPTTFDARTTWQHLRDALRERGLQDARIGVEMSAIAASDWPALQEHLAPAVLVNGMRIAQELRAIKSPAEIGYLRQAVGLAEQGIAAVRDAVASGVLRSELSQAWQTAISTAAAGLPLTGSWEYISVGVDPWGGDARARPGDLIKVDVGCLIEGYTSDTGRSFVLGQPNRVASEIYAALMAGFDAGFARLTPGTPLSEVHRITTEAITARGFASYARGHFGHSLGTGPGSEEWPFISADADICVTPGMVLAFECPWYITGLGGFIIEDQVEITEAGPVSMNSLPRGLITL